MRKLCGQNEAHASEGLSVATWVSSSRQLLNRAGSSSVDQSSGNANPLDCQFES